VYFLFSLREIGEVCIKRGGGIAGAKPEGGKNS